MAEQNDIDLDSVIDRLLEGESTFHLENCPSSSSVILPSSIYSSPFPHHTFSPSIAAPFDHLLHGACADSLQSEETDLEKLFSYKNTKSNTSAQKHVKSLLVSQSSSSSKLPSRSVVCQHS